MPKSHKSISGFRIRAELHNALERALRSDALSAAAAHLEQVQAQPLDSHMADQRDSYIASAEALLDGGGRLTWTTYAVTDAAGVVREMPVAGLGVVVEYPALADAVQVELSLEAGYLGQPEQVRVWLRVRDHECTVSVEAPEHRITSVTAELMALLETYVDESLLPEPPTFKVFIGHGGDRQWKYLQRALNETHGLLAEAFESSERAGYHTLTVVDQLIRSSSVAVVVMTGEDTDADGNLHARENVVHEVGFCQGALGIENTIVVLEDGVSEPSNIAGLTQVRFKRNALIDVEDRIVEVLQQRRQIHDYQRG